MRIVSLFAIACAGMAAPAHAQDVEPDLEEAIICVGGPRWSASADETRRILQDPVPTSLQALVGLPCTYSRSLGGPLLDWHESFGTEQSAAAALAYVERLALAGLPAADAYLRDLARAWSAALPDLRRAHLVPRPEGANYSAPHRFLASRPRYRALERLINERDTYAWLAETYLKAGERFGSARFQAKAATFADALVSSARFAEPLEDTAPARGLLTFNLDPGRGETLQVRAAILRAEISRAPQDISAARALLAALDRPVYARAAMVAYSGGEDFCDISSGWAGVEEVEAACREDGFAARVISYWLARAALDLISDAGPHTPTAPDLLHQTSFDAATQLLPEQRAVGCLTCPRGGRSNELRRLFMLRAAYHRRQLGLEARGANGDDDHRFDALQSLRSAERLTPAYEMPAQFRSIAEAWLSVWRLQDASDEAPSPAEQRYAAHLQALLAGLPAIERGDAR